MATPQHTQDDPHTQALATTAGNLELAFLRAALVAAGALTLKSPLPPEPPMDLREALGRALWLVDAISVGGEPERDYEDWLNGYGGEQLEELLDRLVLVVTPPGAMPN